MSTHRFLLFIAGDGDLGRRARENFERHVHSELTGRDETDEEADSERGEQTSVSLEVIDVVEDPAAARSAQVIATPMLVRVSPEPVVRILGDLQDARHVRQVLGLEPAPRRPPAR